MNSQISITRWGALPVMLTALGAASTSAILYRLSVSERCSSLRFIVPKDEEIDQGYDFVGSSSRQKRQQQLYSRRPWADSDPTDIFVHPLTLSTICFTLTGANWAFAVGLMRGGGASCILGGLAGGAAAFIFPHWFIRGNNSQVINKKTAGATAASSTANNSTEMTFGEVVVRACFIANGVFYLEHFTDLVGRLVMDGIIRSLQHAI
ncbi:hypothetical protein QBC35DRAFT_46474 [Podospora australis]|uniref:Uncharacterized protein n=1 Tax=Podospora australis TaxID=1536484 RepID=A0AAN6WN34_9PEZI|nr:hypothetical protein QBC35DRAFT_46474 [Podospora australis]